jgi:hypothetical protein
MIECTKDGRVLTISYDRLLELYFQNPQFGVSGAWSTPSTPAANRRLSDLNRTGWTYVGH